MQQLPRRRGCAALGRVALVQRGDRRRIGQSHGHLAREPEIADLECARLRDEDVVRLEVAVDERVGVDVLEAAQKLQEVRTVGVKRPVAALLLQPRAQRALAQLHLYVQDGAPIEHGAVGRVASGRGAQRRARVLRVRLILGRLEVALHVRKQNLLLPHLVVAHDVRVVEPREAGGFAHGAVLRALGAGEQHLLHRVLGAVEQVARTVDTAKASFADPVALDELLLEARRHAQELRCWRHRERGGGLVVSRDVNRREGERQRRRASSLLHRASRRRRAWLKARCGGRRVVGHTQRVAIRRANHHEGAGRGQLDRRDDGVR
mmetsp:Transcript_60143/g.137926  ORF Transcript_60143/g.137926 Transcript_60143/m.137926 type:complete len:320 (-) Transcript_60143:1992-2951(-)